MWKTAKNKLIEFLQGEIALLRKENEALRADNAELASLSREAVSLSMQILPLIPTAKASANVNGPGARPRNMTEWMQDLTARSFQRASVKAGSRPPVADIPINANGK